MGELNPVFHAPSFDRIGVLPPSIAKRPGPETIRDLSFMNKHRRLRFADNQLRAVFDLLIAHGKAIKHCVAGIVEPFDDFDELRARAEPVKYSHLVLISLAFFANLLYAERRINVQETRSATPARG